MTRDTDTAAVADLLDVDEERLRRYADREPEPTASVVLGWARADPVHEDAVAAWLQGRGEHRGRAAVADGGGVAALSGAGDHEADTDTGTDESTSDTPPDTHDPYDDEGHLVDGHGRRLYDVTEDTARLHHEATAAGWRHSHELTPYHNLRALVELVDADRREYGRVAYRFVLGYGPGSTPQALDRLGVTP